MIARRELSNWEFSSLQLTLRRRHTTKCRLYGSRLRKCPTRGLRWLDCRLRSSHGDSRKLYEAPAHLFGLDEKADLETYLCVAMQFGWGGHIIPDPPRTYLFLSHDGWVHAASKHLLSKIKEDLEEWEIAGRSA
jgi:hypothetical protein